MSKSEQIRVVTTKLNTLDPSFLEIIDQSELHAGHGGYKSNTLSHVKIKIAALCFDGKSRVQSHRIINDLLSDELNDFLHAMTISITGCK